MLKALLLVRLKALFSTMFSRSALKKTKSPLRTVGFAFLILYVVGALTFAVGMFCGQMLPLAEGGFGWLYFAVIGISALGFCIIGGSFAAKSSLFEAKDNELLLSMPVPPGAILLSRILPLLVLNLVYGAIFLIPAGVMYFLNQGFSAVRFVFWLLGSVLLVLLGTAVAALFGWLLSLLTARSRHKSLLSTLWSLAFLGAYFYFYSNISTYIQKLLLNGESIAASLRRGFPPVYFFGAAAADGDAGSMLLLAVCCLVPTALAFLLLRRSFLRIMTEKRGAARIRYEARAMTASSPFAALYRKEARRFFGSTVYLMNCGLGIVMLLGGAVVLAIKGPSLLSGFTGGSEQLLPAVFACMIGFCSVMDNSTACSISLEGTYYPLLRSMPIRLRDLLGARAALPVSLGAPACILACAIAGIALRFEVGMTLSLMLYGVVMTVWTAVFGLIINLHLPKLDWINETTVVKQSASTFIAIFGGMGFVAAPALLYALVLGMRTPLTLFLLCVSGAFLLLSALGWRYLMTRGEKLLARI